MAVRPFTRADIDPLVDLYNNVTEPLCHGFPANAAEFGAAVATRPSYLRSSVTLVAEQAGRTIGFVRAGVFSRLPTRFTFAEDGDGLVFGPFYAPADAHIGPTLLGAALEHLTKLGVPHVFAFDAIESSGAPFYNAGWSGLSERLPHIVWLYARSGFRIKHRELCLTRPAMPLPPRMDVAAPWRVEHRDRGAQPSIARLLRDSVEGGNCQYSRLFPSRSACPEARTWGYIDGLFVSEAYRGCGCGRVLLCQALTRLTEMGCGPICLTTAASNVVAQNLYFSLGFSQVDSCLTYARTGT